MIDYIRAVIAQRIKTQRGASAVEYGLLVALIAAVIVAAVLLLGNALSGIFDSTADCVSNRDAANCP